MKNQVIIKTVVNMKKYIFIALILALILSFLLGVYLYKSKQINEQIAFEAEFSKSENVIKQAEEIIKETSSSEYKTTPNTKVIEKKYYKDCKHLMQEEQIIKENLINKTQSEFQIEYIGWEIQKFTPSEIAIYKEINDFCNEHYLLKDLNGEIVVYKLDKYGNAKEIIQKTGIQTKYLSEIDIENLKKGIKAFGNKGLKQALEDFE